MNRPNNQERQKPVSFASYAEKWKENYANNYQKPPKKFATGLKIVDLKLAGGLLPEQLVTVGGLPAVGKTAFCLNLASKLAKEGYIVLIYNYEMSFDMVLSRVISSEMNIRLLDIHEYRVPPSQFDLSLLNDTFANLHYCEPAALTTMQIDRDIDSVLGEAPEGRPVLIFDYVQRMPILTGGRFTVDIRTKINENLGILKDIARERQGLVIAVSALTREAAKSGITITAFRETGEWEYASDVIIAFATAKQSKDGKWVEATGEEVQDIRAENARQNVLLKFLKVKHHREGNCMLVFNRDYQKFEPFQG